MPDTKSKWIKLDELREPAMLRVIEAMRELEEEASILLDDAVIAAAELKKGRGDGGPFPR